MKLAALSLIAVLSSCITPQTIEDGMYSAANCSVSTSISCATQAIGGCLAPSITEPGDAWESYAICLWDRAKTCQLRGLARCGLAGMVEVAGFPVIAGGVSCDVELVRQCVEEARIETKLEALKTVSFCYREVCTSASIPEGIDGRR